MSMHKLHVCYKFQATLSATVFHCITTEQTLSPHFFVEGLCFFCKSFTNPRCSFLLRYNVDCNTYILGLIIKLKIYRTTLLYTSHTTDANTLGKGCIITLKLIKHFKVKVTLVSMCCLIYASSPILPWLANVHKSYTLTLPSPPSPGERGFIHSSTPPV